MQGTSSTDIASDLLKAKVAGKAIVGFETALITHGLPRPLNLDVFREMTRICKENSAVPAAVAVIDGRLRIGLSDEEISRLACMEAPVKIGIRDLPFAISRDVTGGTTVSATLRACRMSGIRVMATGGIGGVHRGLPLDVSSDLIELSRSRAICVCSGPKSVLDVKVTYEILEAMGVPVAAYGADELPSFFSRSCGMKAPWRIDTPQEAARVFEAMIEMNVEEAMVLANPVEEALSIGPGEIDAMMSAIVQWSQGKDVTPLLLSELRRMSGGRTLEANRSLLLSNTALAARIAVEMASE